MSRTLRSLKKAIDGSACEKAVCIEHIEYKKWRDIDAHYVIYYGYIMHVWLCFEIQLNASTALNSFFPKHK